MRRAALIAFACVLVCLLAAPAFARLTRVGDALCVSWSGPALLGLAPTVRDAYLGALGDAGWPLLRTDVTWSAIEPTPGARDFSRYDALLAAAEAKHVRLIGLLDYGVHWAAPGTPADDDHYPPDDPATFAAFAGAAAARWRGRVPAWEIWNEPNLFIFWKPGPDAARWATLAAEAARSIHHADHRATVVTGGIAPTIDAIVYGTDWGFLGAAAASSPGLLRRFGAGAFHPYSLFQAPPPEEDHAPLGPSLVEQIADFRTRLSEARRPRLSAWATEIGWHTAAESGFPGFPPGVSELDQARFLVRSFVLALAHDVERVCWYTVVDGPNAAHNKEDAFGLFRWPTDRLDPKPAWGAAVTLARVLGPTHFVRDLREELGLPADAYAFGFRSGRPAERVIVAWATRDGVAEASIETGQRAARRITMDGTETPLGRPDRVRLELGTSPLYLVIDDR